MIVEDFVVQFWSTASAVSDSAFSLIPNQLL